MTRVLSVQFTVLTAHRGGVETGFSASGVLELWVETGVTNLQVLGQTLYVSQNSAEPLNDKCLQFN